MTQQHPSDETLAAYALDALARDEAAFLARHLVECAHCQHEVDSLREAVSAMALAVPQVAPPASLRARVLAQATSAPQEAVTSAAPVPATASRVMSSVSPAARSSAGERMAPRSRSMLPWLAAAACATVAIGLGAAWQGARSEQQTLLAAVARADSLLANQQLALAARDSLLLQVLGPEVETTTLAATGSAPTMRLFFDRTRGVMVVSARRLPPAPDGRTYQLWGIGTDGRPVGLGLFNTGADGAAIVSLQVAADARFTISAVTDEPAGGSPQPTSTPFLVGSWRESSE